MAEQRNVVQRTWDDPRGKNLLILGAVAVVLFVAWLVVQERNSTADGRAADAYYCAQEGVGPLDRAPNTGLRCAELG